MGRKRLVKKAKVKTKTRVVKPKEQKPRQFRYRDCTCGALNDTRFKICPLCNKPTYKERQQKVPRNFQPVNWQELKKGDLIFVISNDIWFSEGGDAIQMGESGQFTVMRTCQSGVVCYNNVVGFCFFDTVTTGKSRETGIVRGTTKFYISGNSKTSNR